MRPNKSFFAAAIAAAAVAVSAPAFAGNLIDNGDFSQPFTDGFAAHLDNGSFGWSNASESTYEIGYSMIYGMPCADFGCQNLEVNGDNLGDVSQTVSGLTVGDDYQVSFLYGGRTGGGPEGIDFLLNGVQEGGAITGSFGVWTPYTFLFTATGTTETVEFQALNLGGAPSVGNEITEVSLGLPEPASWALMIAGFGLAGVGLRRRRATACAA
jgi:hypothetical protein